ncbi:MAG: hypothetical protein M3294_09035 [Pseudomonadota bacterium]|nr:hypothetical protein [Pseudomonadota bacterium]
MYFLTQQVWRLVGLLCLALPALANVLLKLANYSLDLLWRVRNVLAALPFAQ